MTDLEASRLDEAGYERVVWRDPSHPKPHTERWLLGAGAACLVLVVIAALNDNFGPHAATARMERILVQLDRMSAIRPETARAAMRIIRQPGYDCEQVACDTRLKARNMAVRFRLETLLATKASAVAASVKPAMAGAPTEE
jgi:hypothetical protein